MLSFETVIERAFTGTLCSEQDFELKVFVPNLRRVVDKYAIKYDPENPVPADDELADRVWAAAMEFLSETGVYCTDTEIASEKVEVSGTVGPVI